MLCAGWCVFRVWFYCLVLCIVCVVCSLFLRDRRFTLICVWVFLLLCMCVCVLCVPVVGVCVLCVPVVCVFCAFPCCACVCGVFPWCVCACLALAVRGSQEFSCDLGFPVIFSNGVLRSCYAMLYLQPYIACAISAVRCWSILTGAAAPQ